MNSNINNNKSDKPRLRLVLDLEGPLLEKFNKLKEDYGIVSGTDTLRTIIRELYEVKEIKECKVEA